MLGRVALATWHPGSTAYQVLAGLQLNSDTTCCVCCFPQAGQAGGSVFSRSYWLMGTVTSNRWPQAWHAYS
jgi:hypothetical protein